MQRYANLLRQVIENRIIDRLDPQYVLINVQRIQNIFSFGVLEHLLDLQSTSLPIHTSSKHFNIRRFPSLIINAQSRMHNLARSYLRRYG